MKNILSKQSQRFLIILEHLYFNEYSTFEDLADICDASLKTIQMDINKINQFIKPLEIIYSTQHDCKILLKSNISADFIYSCILTDSIEFTVLEQIFFEKEPRLEDYADSLFISLSTLKRIISRINKQTKQLGFHISTNPVQLVGDEFAIRKNMMYFFKEKYINPKYPFNDFEQKVFDELIFSFVNIENRFFNFPDIERFRLIVYTSLVRLQHGYHYNFESIENSEKKIEFPIIENYLYADTFEALFNVTLTEQHIIELSHPILSDKFVFSIDDLKKISQETSPRQKELLHITQLVDDISMSLQEKLSTKNHETLISKLFNIRLWSRSKAYLLYNYKHNFIVNLSKDYPLVYYFLNKKITSNPKFSHFEEHEVEEFIYVLTTHWEQLFQVIQAYYPKFKAGVFMHSDNEHTHFMVQLLNQKYDSHFIFEPIIFTDYHEAIESFSQFDVIITDMSALKKEHPQTISVNLYPSPSDLDKIYNMYYKLFDIRFNG